MVWYVWCTVVEHEYSSGVVCVVHGGGALSILVVWYVWCTVVEHCEYFSGVVCVVHSGGTL